MNEEREYQEFLQWLEFKRQRSQETTVVFNYEQPPLMLEQEPLPEDYRKLDRSAPNAGKAWSQKDTRMAWFAYNGGCTEQEIAEYFDRTRYAVHQHIYKIKTGVVKL